GCWTGEREREVGRRAFRWRRRKDRCREEKHHGKAGGGVSKTKESAAHENLQSRQGTVCAATSGCMSESAKSEPSHPLGTTLAQALGARRSARLKTIVRYTGLPPEVNGHGLASGRGLCLAHRARCAAAIRARAAALSLRRFRGRIPR